MIWDEKTFDSKLRAFESIGFTQGEAVKLSTVPFIDFTSEVQQALEEFKDVNEYDYMDDVRKDNERRYGKDLIDRYFGKNVVDESYDYNNIGRNELQKTKYQCEFCNCGYRSNESLSVHLNDVHTQPLGIIEGYGVRANESSYHKSNEMDFSVLDVASGNDWYKVDAPFGIFPYVSINDGSGHSEVFKCDKCGHEVTVSEGGAPVMVKHLRSHGIAVESKSVEVEPKEYQDYVDTMPHDGYSSSCTDGQSHIPQENKSSTTCEKCGQRIEETGLGSGHWMTKDDERNWDFFVNGLVGESKVKSNESVTEETIKDNWNSYTESERGDMSEEMGDGTRQTGTWETLTTSLQMDLMNADLKNVSGENYDYNNIGSGKEW